MTSYRSLANALCAAMLAAMPVAALAQAHGPASDSPPVKPGVTTWLEPTAAPVFPQTDAEKKAGMQDGRTLPTPEFLQPQLDAALPAFAPTKGLRITRTFKAGSSDVLPGLVDGWVKAFQKYQPGFKLEVERPLAGSLGALELIKGNLDLVFVSRELKPSDVSGFRDKFGYDPFSMPISGGTWRHFGFLDAMAFMTHPGNPIRQLSFAQIDAAFSSTRHRGGKPIKTWGDLGLTGEWANRPVHLYGIKPWNGFEEFIRQRVLSVPGKRGEWNDSIHFDDTFFAVARRVAADPDALGYTGMSAIDSEVAIVPVTTGEGPALEPNYKNVAMADYPLTRVIYLNTNAPKGKPLDPALAEFARFILSREGQAVILKQGIYLPLRARQVTASLDYMKSPR